MGIFPVEFPTTTADSFESFRVLHYLAFIKEGVVKSGVCFLNFLGRVLFSSNLNY